jgi:chromatin remodeling complex protein RSC6
MSSVVFVKCATPEQEDMVKLFCMQNGIQFEQEEAQGHEYEWLDEYRTPSKQLACFLGPPYLNRNGKAKPKDAFDCIVRYIHTKKLCGPNVKWGIILNETLQDLFNTTETAMEYSHLREAVEFLFQA